MHFGLDESQTLLRDTVRSFFDTTLDGFRRRELIDSPDGHDPVLWRRMAGELGLHGLAVPEHLGGQGSSFFELTVAVHEAGRVLLTGPFLASAVLAGSCLAYAGAEEHLAGVADGSTIATLAVADPDGGWEPNHWGSGVTARTTADGIRLSGTSGHVLDGGLADLLVVAARGAEGLGLYVVRGAEPGVRPLELPVLDRTRRMATVEFDDAWAEPLGDPGEAEHVLARTRNAANAALAAEAAGGIARCLEMSVAYASTRTQFGRPIGGFQAVKHLCADMYVAAETALSAAWYAAWCVATDAPDATIAASLARAHTADAYTRVAADTIQVHGGIGFTWEHDAHLYYRRARFTAHHMGSAGRHRERVLAGLGL
ncbi:acyl-CoA dehydrogenase family protein [Pseudonocardia sp. RS010]|uniref:acyl-CoA dehydrogenase family protein n=1 Tax=Pseudonocardia sp. RS010 TaxID=3385979 RepID=UPI0039A3B6F3